MNNQDMYEIHPINFEVLKDKLADMQKKAKKLGVAPVKLVEHGTKVIDHKRVMPGGKVTTFQEERILVTIEGETPKLEGWTLVAKVELCGDERLVSCVPGLECPEQYRKGAFDCDHCKADRRRKGTFILKHDDGTYKQVGRHCIKDFLGGVSPEQLLNQAQYLLDTADEARQCAEGGMGYAPMYIGTLEYLCSTAICIRRLGWLSRGKAGPDETSTSDDAWTLLTPPSSGEGLRGHNQWVERNNLVYQDRDREQAEAALEWARALPTEGVVDYIYNLGVACRADNVVYKTMGLVASALVAHANHLNRQAEIVQRKKDDAGKARGWVGEVKDRVLFTHMEVLYMRYVEGRWGTSTLVAFEDPVGNLYKWFSSRSLDDLNVGDVVSVKGTIKKHSEYKGVKETQLSRCQIA